MTQETLRNQIKGVILEEFDGPPEGYAYFSDRGEDAGLVRLLRGVSAEEASEDVAGSSIAAHANHLTFSLKASTALLQDAETRPNWSESWSVARVDAPTWAGLQESLASARDEFLQTVESSTLDNEMMAGILLGNVAHIAYHLGVMRQKLKVLRHRPSTDAQPLRQFDETSAISDKAHSPKPPPEPSTGSRLAILLVSIPGLLIWGMILLYVALFFVNVLGADGALGGGGRLLYAQFMCLVSIVGAVAAVWVTRRVYRGKASLLWVAATFVGGVLDIMAFGLLGD